jgi:hypothetical protein
MLNFTMLDINFTNNEEVSRNNVENIFSSYTYKEFGNIIITDLDDDITYDGKKLCAIEFSRYGNNYYEEFCIISYRVVNKAKLTLTLKRLIEDNSYFDTKLILGYKFKDHLYSSSIDSKDVSKGISDFITKNNFRGDEMLNFEAMLNRLRENYIASKKTEAALEYEIYHM